MLGHLQNARLHLNITSFSMHVLHVPQDPTLHLAPFQIMDFRYQKPGCKAREGLSGGWAVSVDLCEAALG